MISGGLLFLGGLVAVFAFSHEERSLVTREAERERAEALERDRIAADTRARQLERERAEQEHIRRVRRERAFALLKTASGAASSGDCATTIALEREVRDLDTHVHDAWFLRDPAIKRCLDAAAPAAPPVPVP